MGDIVLFSTFGFVSASCCLSVGHNVHIADCQQSPFFIAEGSPSAQQPARNKLQNCKK